MSAKGSGLLAAVLLVGSVTANAGTVTFTATGSPDVSGFVQFNDAYFTGSSSDFVSNTAITGLSLIVLGYSFNLGDVVMAASTILNTAVGPQLIVNGAGGLAFNGAQTIAFFPDGFAGTASDGDASLTLDTNGSFDFGGSGWENTFAVRWSAVPEPGTLALLGLGLAGLGLSRRRKAA